MATASSIALLTGSNDPSQLQQQINTLTTTLNSLLAGSVTVGGNLLTVNGGLVTLATAITANSTTTTYPVGTLGTTSHATGNTKIFISDGSKWQYPAVS